MRIAPLSNTDSGPPGASRSTIAGILLLGEIFRNAGSCCSFLPMFTRVDLIRQPDFLEHDRGLASVRRAPDVKFDHRLSFTVRWRRRSDTACQAGKSRLAPQPATLLSWCAPSVSGATARLPAGRRGSCFG